MSIAQASGPVPLSRVWSGDRVIAEDLTGEDLEDVLELNSDAMAWWVLPRSDDYGAAEIRKVAQALDLDELAIKQVLSGDQRAKFEQRDSARIVLTSVAEVDQENTLIITHPLSIIATERAVIVVCDPIPGFDPARILAGHRKLLTSGGTDRALQVVLGAIVQTYESAVQWLEEASDELADALFEERPLEKAEQLHAFRLRRALSMLRRVSEPMRNVLDNIEAELPTIKPKARAAKIDRGWTILAEEHQRAADAANGLREALSSIFDASLALGDVRMNMIMKKLTGWAAILAVPTLVTSFVGMNVGFPLFGTLGGFWFYFAIMIISSGVLFVVFRRKDWL